MNIDLSGVSVEPLAVDDAALHDSLEGVLARITALTAVPSGTAHEQRIRQLGAAVNLTMGALEEINGVVDTTVLPELIERVADLAVTGDNLEVQLGIAGDLRVDRGRRLVVDDVLASLRRVPPGAHAAAVREGVSTLQRLLALLLLHGWTDALHPDDPARQTARRAIVDAVQGRMYGDQAAV